MTLLALSSIRTNGGTQPRAHISEEAVGDYAEAFQAGDKFPPVVVFFDGTHHWLADGFHRVAGALKAGLEEIEADVRQGQQRDAVLYCLGANADPRGLRRTNEDKRRAVMTMLRDEEWKGWSDRDVAKHCCVTHPFVSKLREELSGNDYQMPTARKFTRGGKTHTMKPRGTPLDTIRQWAAEGKLGKRAASELEALGKSAHKKFVQLVNGGATPADALKELSREPGDDRVPPQPKPQPPREELKDRVGNVLPDHLRDAFADPGLPTLIEELEQVEAMFRVESWVERAGKLTDHYGFILIDKFQEHLWESKRRHQLALEALQAGIPHAVCPKCQGVNSQNNGKTCKGCRGYGAVPETRYAELTS